jgi:hypothetical protein
MYRMIVEGRVPRAEQPKSEQMRVMWRARHAEIAASEKRQRKEARSGEPRPRARSWGWRREAAE